MNNLDLKKLSLVIFDTFKKSRDGAHYSAEERDKFYELAENMSYQYKRLVISEIPGSLSNDVQSANNAIIEINRNLDQSLQTLQEIIDFINDVRALVGILDVIIQKLPH